jgi:hypothetical protein
MFKLQHKQSGRFFEQVGVCTVEQHTTLFNNQDELLGSLSMAKEMPLTKTNKAIIENAHYILTANGKRQFDVIVWLGDMPYKDASFVYTVESNLAKYTLFFDLAQVANLLKVRKLSEASHSAEDQMDFANYDAFQAYMMETVDGTAATHPMVFAPYRNTGAYQVIPLTDYHLYPDLVLPAETLFNRWEMNEVGVGSFKVDHNFPIGQTQTPFFYVVYLLKRVMNYLGYPVTGKWCTQESSQRITMGTNIAVPAPILPDFTYFMPDILISDWLKDLRSNFGLLIDFDFTRQVSIVESITNLKAAQTTVDLRNAKIAGTYRETTNARYSYLVTRAVDDKDTAFTDDEKAALPSLTIGITGPNIEQKPIALKSVATKMVVEAAPSRGDIMTPIGANWRIPFLKQPIAPAVPLNQITLATYADRGNFKPRYLYYYGKKPNDAGYLYPYISADNLDVLGAVIDNYSLALNASAFSFHELRNYFQFIYDSRPFEMKFTLSRAQFFSVVSNARILVHDENMATVSGFLDVNTADLGLGKKYVAAITIYPHIIPNNTIQITNESPVIPPPEPPFDNGVVYVGLTMINYQTNENEHSDPPFLSFSADVQVKFFMYPIFDNPTLVVDLPVRIRQRRTNSVDGIPHDTILEFTANGDTVIPFTHMPTDSQQAPGVTDWTYELLDSADYIIR